MTDPRQPEATVPHTPAAEPSGDTTRPRDNTPAEPSDTTLVRSGSPSQAATASGVGGSGERYRFGSELARGGMGVVYRAEDRALGREVALKVLAPALIGTEAARRFIEEARITAKLEHPSIPPVHDLGTLPDGRPFLAMKLIRGHTLAEELKKRAAPTDDLDRFAEIFAKVCEAVAFAHSRGIIHRDLKPANVMVGAFGEVQVMDWGLAKEVRDTAREQIADAPAPLTPPGPEDRTQMGQVMGTPAYMAPEQARGELDRIDERADVFALGGILCAILSGQPPYTGKFGRMVLRKAADADLGDALARLTNAIDGFAGQTDSTGSAALVGLARRCLDPDPDKRPDHAGVVAAMVHSIRTKVRQQERAVELDRAVAEVGSTGRKVRQGLAIALQFGLPLVLLGLAVAFVVRRPFGDYTAMAVVFVLAFAGIMYFALHARER